LKAPALSPWISTLPAYAWPDTSCSTAVSETGVTVSANVALCNWLPLVALNAIEREPVGVVGGMNIKACPLPIAGSAKVDAGNTIAPGGNPVIATLTAPLKPFCPTTEITTGGLMVPTVIVSVGGFTDKLKSCAGGGPDEPPPPQPAARNAVSISKQTNLLETLKILLIASIPDSFAHRANPYFARSRSFS